MPDRGGFERPPLYCRNCGAQVRQGNAFCVSCGERLDVVEGSTQPLVRRPRSRNRRVLDQGSIKVALFVAEALLLLIVAYLLLSYSVLLGFVLIGSSVLAVLVIRKYRGRQTRLEQQVFQKAGRYGGSARKAYEDGKHREFAQNAYRQSKEVYEGTSARYRDWSESRAAGRDRPPTPNTGVPFQGALQSALQSVPQNLLRWIKGLPIVLKVAGAAVGALLLLTILSPLGLLLALVLFVVGSAAVILRVAQRRSVKGWGIVAVASRFLVLVFGSISNALYGSESVESTGVGGGAKDRDAKEKKDAAREEVQDRSIKATQEAPPPKQQVVPDPATKRYNEQVQDYNKRVQEGNRQRQKEEERIQKEEERRRYEQWMECARPGPPYC